MEEQPANDAPNVDGGDEPASEETNVDTNPLAAVEAERDKFKDQLLRTAADYDNFRKRSKREIADTIRRVREDVLREILPIADNLQRASEATASAKDVKSVAEGVSMVKSQLDEIIGRFGIEPFESIGKVFDPNMHDAVQRQPSMDYPPGTVVAEMMPGYMMGDKLLRAAMVVVAAPPVDAGGSAAGAPAKSDSSHDELSVGDDGETLIENSNSEDSEET